jgi:hypothetical protein
VLKSLKKNTNDNDKWYNSLGVLRISTYDVRTYEMILRIKSVILDPILSDRYIDTNIYTHVYIYIY